ncbi:MFS transporter [Actinoplanes sp. NBC_00393]|uniref:MFS transporter n=1 Tax=Actinoplanes sp. NBC_00393 TaxID=2975953 RepID=UPI002E1BC316
MVTLARHPLVGVLTAQACTLSANRVLTVAVPWLLLTATDDVRQAAVQAGVVVLCQTAPYALMQWLSGPLLDRIGPRRISVAGDLTAAALLTVLAFLPAAPIWLIAIVLAGVGAADGPATAAKRLLIPAAATAAGQPITRGAGFATALERASTAFGPALAGWLIAIVGGAPALWVSAAFLGAAAAIATLAVATPAPARHQVTDRYATRLRDGARYLGRNPSLRALAAMFLVTNLLDQALISILLPVWARTGGHSPAVVGIALSAAGATAVGTALLTAWLGTRLPRRTTYLIAVVISGPTRILVLALGWPPEAVVAVWAVAGLGSGVFNPLLEALQIESTPSVLRGRVLTLITALAWAGIPVGGLFGAGLLASAGLSTALWICGAAYLAAVLYPGWRVNWHPTQKSIVPAQRVPAPTRWRISHRSRHTALRVPAS